MFHVELRQFPHNAWRFNLSDGQLRSLLERWVRGELVDFGERRWNPQQARLTIIEGPQLELAQLTMGRGWRTAQKEGEDVTVRVLAAIRATSARPSASGPAGAPGVGGSGAAGAAAGPGAARGVGAGDEALGLAVQLGSLLGSDAARLLEAWRTVSSRSPGLPPSQALAQAEQELRRER